ncbi:MAG: glycoside hydrolase family 43 protein [Treponema sp.]|nr:glycoside hydrolase family 43 protein [Treponema sp.]
MINNPVAIVCNYSETELKSVSPYNNPDPYMIEYEGTYYCYTTGWSGVNVLRSENLESFEHMGYALEAPDQINYWAPCVIFYQGLFYMYYSSVPLSSKDDPFAQRLKVAVADNPLGPFTYKKQLLDYWSIDAHVVEKDGGLHLFFAAKGTGPNGKYGTMCFYQKLDSPESVTGTSRLVLYPTIEQELFDGGPEYTLEGPFYFEHDGIGFLMYSANRWEDPDYFVGYATCDANIPLEQAVFTKYPDNDTYRPLIGSDKKFTGMGHNSIIRGPADAESPDGKMFIVYHGYPRVTEGLPGKGRIRRLCISEININGKEITAVPNN